MRYLIFAVHCVVFFVTSPTWSQDWQAEFVTGRDATPATGTITKPALGDSYSDPVTGLQVRRVSSAEGTRFNRIVYSRIQAENADGTLFFTYHGNSEFRVYDVATTKQVQRLPLEPKSELQWHPTNPNVIRYTSGDNAYIGSLRLYEMSARGGRKKVIADLTNRLPWESLKSRSGGNSFIADGSEGSPSADGNRYAWAVFDGSERMVGLVSYDLETDTILGTMDIPPRAHIDNLSMSPSGKYVVVSGAEVTVYNADFSNPRVLLPSSEHSDIAIGTDGEDYYLHVDFASQDGDVVAINLKTGDKIVLFSMYDENVTTSIHISGKAFNKPGWAVMSTYAAKDRGDAWTYDKVFAITFDPSLDEQLILNLAHTQNCAESYWTEPHAVPNRDLSRVYFNSNWGSCDSDAEAYQVTVPPIGDTR